MYYDKMREVRKAKGLTQAKVAEALGISQQQYLKYEKGINEFPLRYFIEFCKLTGSDPKEILELNEP